MRVCKARQSLVLLCERGKVAHDLRRLFEDDLRRFAQNYHVGVISDVARCCAEVDYPLRLRELLTVCINVGHNVVSYLTLALFGNLEIYVVAVRFKLCDLLVGYIETELFLSLCKRYPQSSPCAEFEILGEDVLHLCRRIPCGKRGNVFLSVVHIWIYAFAVRKLSFHVKSHPIRDGKAMHHRACAPGAVRKKLRRFYLRGAPRSLPFRDRYI